MREGVSRFSVTTFFSQSAKSFRREPFSVSLFSGMEKFFAYEGNFTIFYRNFFCLTVPKNFVGEPFHVSQKLLVSKSFMDKKTGREYHDFPFPPSPLIHKSFRYQNFGETWNGSHMKIFGTVRRKNFL